ncbi:SMC family ATPase [Vibrio sp. ZSDE26]|uniref:Nuclease SbcCD subunit C n=1 Tax=Vibrio amylolyticus TaxID=2847292 RepID=A0A9X1XMY4_9VIBR|nr:SMC family ATPase [Vibrio amylolyticus]MCK6263920.1 SMC family ATPase [Vibrio amylolyticus]
MQPLNLTLQAFGPFAQSQNIDFTTMGNAPLFLINGPTGSGKSSILDAICFALYGETTGSDRTGEQMRCDYADTQLLTEVTFEFKLFNRVYKVVRSPDQEVPKKRGEGTTKRTHSATLYQLDNGEETLLANKPTPVLKEVRGLIGLDVKQFRQVMVLPQGKFRELLTATSKEREQIFGQLFQTHIYSAIERALFDRAAGIRKAKDEFDNQTKGVLDVAGVVDENELEVRLKENTEQLTLVEEQLSIARSTLERAQNDEKNALDLDNRFSQLKQKKEQLTQHLVGESHFAELKVQRDKASLAQSLDVIHSQLTSSTRLLSEKEHALTQAKDVSVISAEATVTANKAYEVAAKRVADLPELQNQTFSLEAARSKLIERREFELRLAQSKKDYTIAEQNRDNLQKAMVKLEHDLTIKRASFDQAKQNQQLIPVVLQEFNSLVEQRELEKKSQALKETLHGQNEVRFVLEKKLAIAKDQTSVATAYADNLEYQWHSTQAAQLAKQLRLGEPCPVCGSADHPTPAQFLEEEVTKDNVDVARAHQYEMQTLEVKAAENLADSDKEIALTQQAISGIEEQLRLKEPRTFSQITEQIAQLELQLSELKKSTPEKAEFDLQQVEKQLLEAKSNLDKQVEVVGATKIQIAREQTEIESRTLAHAKKTHDLPSVEKELARIRQLIEEITQQEIIARTQNEQVQRKLLSAETLVKELDEQLQLLQRQKGDIVTQWQSMLDTSPFMGEQEYLLSRRSKPEIDVMESDITQFEQRRTALSSEVSTLEESIEGKVLPEFETLTEKRKAEEANYADVMGRYTQTKSVQDRYLEVQKKLAVLLKENEKLTSEYKIVGTLSDVANGKTGSKISLHRFVLGVLLDDVLIQASMRLRKMSKGRYELKRKEQRAKGNVGSGLDLMVEDGYTSKLRDVATLSGGESFMAALALALGLSDVVQSYSGGIRLDTLFIDEGFGSLDPESLDLAIETLIDLQLGGRTIGIISHVSELKEQMPLRVDVEPSRKGSVIRLNS